MNRQEYMEELRQCLKDSDALEADDVIRYCEEYFDEAGDDNEQQAIQDLGKPQKMAAQIKAEAAIRSNIESSTQNTAKPFHTIWVIFLGIMALPIAIPLVLVAVVLMIVFFLVVFVLLLAGFVVAFAGIMGAIFFFISVILVPFSAASIMRIGGGFLLLGIGLMLVVGMNQALHSVIPWFTKLAANLYQKAKGGHTNEI